MSKAISKVVFGGNTLIDLTQDTVVADKLLQGYTAHGADGNVVTTARSGDAKKVLTVEGKSLALKIDYNDENSHLSVS